MHVPPNFKQKKPEVMALAAVRSQEELSSKDENRNNPSNKNQNSDSNTPPFQDQPVVEIKNDDNDDA